MAYQGYQSYDYNQHQGYGAAGGADWNAYNDGNRFDTRAGPQDYDRFGSTSSQQSSGPQYDRFGVPIQSQYDNSYGGGGYQAGPPPVPPPMQQQHSDYGGGYQSGGGHDRFSDNSYQVQAPNYNNNNNNFGNNGYGNQYQQQPPPPPPQQQQAYDTRNSNFQRPPTQAQSFGVQGYNFQYSNCTGRRKALLIGINYFNSKAALRGCINDVQNVRHFLMKHGYKDQDMVILTDDQRDPRCVPTRANIIRGMQWLVKGAQPNDSLFLHYSGHGGQTEDLDGDEDDGYDETIYPVDYQRAGMIVDDEMYAILVRPLLPGVRLTALFDSCHSGTVLDLPYVYSAKGVLKEPNLLSEAGSGLLSAFTSYTQGDMGKVMSTMSGLFKRVSNGNKGYEKTKQTKTAPCDAIMISGCKDSQTSADAMENGRATGAMSHAFISVMSRNPNQSYITLLSSMRDVLQGKYEQKPQLSSSHPIDCNYQFIF